MMKTYVSMFVSTIIFRLMMGAFHSQRVTILSDIVAKEHVHATVGFAILFQGFGYLIVPPVGGQCH